MRILGLAINCPYYSNKIGKDGKITYYGFLGGKGEAGQIRSELEKKVKAKIKKDNIPLTVELIKKTAKRHRIGIDCSGLTYRLLDLLIRSKYRNCQLESLDIIFPQGIKKTNANTLTSRKFCQYLSKPKNFRLGDMIRMMEGKHAAVILDNSHKFITYIHSSSYTLKEGVHPGRIKIVSESLNLEKQIWEEEARKGGNFGIKYFNPKKGDGVFRLKAL